MVLSLDWKHLRTDPVFAALIRILQRDFLLALHKLSPRTAYRLTLQTFCCPSISSISLGRWKLVKKHIIYSLRFHMPRCRACFCWPKVVPMIDTKRSIQPWLQSIWARWVTVGRKVSTRLDVAPSRDRQTQRLVCVEHCRDSELGLPESSGCSLGYWMIWMLVGFWPEAAGLASAEKAVGCCLWRGAFKVFGGRDVVRAESARSHCVFNQRRLIWVCFTIRDTSKAFLIENLCKRIPQTICFWWILWWIHHFNKG